MTLDHLENRGVIARERGVGVNGAETGPLKVRPQRPVVALDVEQVEPEPLTIEPRGASGSRQRKSA